MNLEKAIEILATRCLINAVENMGDYKDALLLSIEALKRVKVLRVTYHSVNYDLLPGETPPGDSL